MRTSIGMPKELWREIKKKSIDLDMNLSEIATEALRQWLESKRAQEEAQDD